MIIWIYEILVLIILIVFNKYSFAAEWISEASAKISILKKIELPGGSVYSSFEVNGASKDNVRQVWNRILRRT